MDSRINYTHITYLSTKSNYRIYHKCFRASLEGGLWCTIVVHLALLQSFIEPLTQTDISLILRTVQELFHLVFAGVLRVPRLLLLLLVGLLLLLFLRVITTSSAHSTHNSCTSHMSDG